MNLKEAQKLARQNGIYNNTFRYRIDNGWDLYRAATEEPRPRTVPKQVGQCCGSDLTQAQRNLCNMMKSLPLTPNLNYKMGFRG